MLLNNDSAHQLSVPRCQIQLDIFNPISSFSSYDIRIFWLYIWACENVCVIPIAENQWSSQKGSVCQPRPADALIHINIMVPQVYCLASFIHKKNRKLKFLTLICDEVGAVCKFLFFFTLTVWFSCCILQMWGELSKLPWAWNKLYSVQRWIQPGRRYLHNQRHL